MAELRFSNEHRIRNQMVKRGWSDQQIREAMATTGIQLRESLAQPLDTFIPRLASQSLSITPPAEYFTSVGRDSNMNAQVYVSLIDEGVRVWRPVPARKIGPDIYILGSPPDFDSQLESWEFPPGSTVIAENRKTADGNILAAVRLAQKGKKSA